MVVKPNLTTMIYFQKTVVCELAGHNLSNPKFILIIKSESVYSIQHYLT